MINNAQKPAFSSAAPAAAGDGKTRIKYICYAFLIFSVLFLPYVSASRINTPASKDEALQFDVLKSYFNTGVPEVRISGKIIEVYHETNFLSNIMYLLYKVFGYSETITRIVQLIIGVLTITALFFIIAAMYGKPVVNGFICAVTGSLLFSVNPAVSQGFLLTITDSIILVPACLILCYCFFNYLKTGALSWAVWTGVSVFIAMWCKPSTPLPLSMFLILLSLFYDIPARDKRIIAVSILTGLIAALTLWFIYSGLKGASFENPFKYYLSRVEGGVGSSFSLK